MLICEKGLASIYDVENLVRIFYADAQICTDGRYPRKSDVVLAFANSHRLAAMIRTAGTVISKVVPRQSEADADYELCRMLYDLLCGLTQKHPSWGMLTGVRPVRLINDRRYEGRSEAEIDDLFLHHYACSPQKYALAKSIADRQTPFLANAQPRDCSVYIGIPFCPTRCSYCSFVSRTIESQKDLVQPYVDCLCKELKAISQVVAQNRLQVKTVYIGGGTPTAINASQLTQLMQAVNDHFSVPSLQEFTVEAGRPDCTDSEKLAIIRQGGATRISINPQTFRDDVLQNIGRRHTARDIELCFEQARKAGHRNINMDLIAGLPGDTVDGFAYSLRRAIGLGPENITVHTLTLKRASNLVIDNETFHSDNVAAMIDDSATLADYGYVPYYLYRQKSTLQNLENTGWCKPGFEGLYNIYIMEEVHTILSAGAGGSSKLCVPHSGKIRRFFNYKYPAEYIRGFDEMLHRKEAVSQYYAQFGLK